ncbi:MAG: aspartate ammonia-lyase [Desulfarculus sp.]|jgi:aspartate ammonia-lyase|nr:MAG: aspartate ammonia-lyase [Desulfarculus sp.]
MAVGAPNLCLADAGAKAGDKAETAKSSGTRMEHDFLGDKAVPASAYYGVQAERAIENFPFNSHTMEHYPNFIIAFAYVKKAAALANNQIGDLSDEKTKAIVAACDEVIAGKLHDQFPIDMIQGGAGTSTNMTVNEVLANRGLEIMGKAKGQYEFLHPNDDLNYGQSTNDTYPTSIKLAVILGLEDAFKSIKKLEDALAAKGEEFKNVIKMGRTEMQDAVPVTLGQEFSGFAYTIREATTQLKQARDAFYIINMGGTAIGTGITSSPKYAPLVTKILAKETGYPFVLAPSLVGASSDAGGFVQMSGALKRMGLQISKVCNDLRLMSSGPRAGLYEIRLPPMQPGSSIMPGKVNPVIPEVVSSVAYQLAGFDTTVSMAAELSSLELNPVEAIIAYSLLQGVSYLTTACDLLADKCVKGIQANKERLEEMVKKSIGIVTALKPVLGYEKSAAIAKEALKTNGSVYDLVLQKGWLSKEQLDDLLKPEKMTQPRELPSSK